MNRECPNCHVVFWKDPGESLGAMYVDYAMAFGAFFVFWGIVSLYDVPMVLQLVILCAVPVASLLLFYPLSRSLWTMLVFLSGGIEGPRLRVLTGRGRRPR